MKGRLPAPQVMNNSSPLIPQGSLLEQQNKGRARFKVAILCVFGFHVLLFGGVLMLGCKKETSTAGQDAAGTSSNSMDTAMSAPAPTNDLSAPTAPTNTPVVTTPTPATPATPVTPVTPVTAPGTAQEYTLVKGDTYSSISKKFGVSVKALETANPTMPATKLMPGKKIEIPAPTVAASTTTGTTATLSPDNSDLYVVKSGDSLTSIAHNHGTTVKALMAENSLKTTKIRVGDKLHLPAKTSVPPAMPADSTPAPATATSTVPSISAPSASLR